MCGQTNTASRNQAKFTAEQQASDDAARKADITQGQGAIDSAFAQFNDPYYAGYQNAYTGYYNPQVDDQYANTKDKLTSQLAGQGILNSTAGAGQLAKLTKEYGDEKSQIANSSVDAVNSLKNKISQQKTDLYSQNTASADPSAAASLAQGAASSLAAPQSFQSLGTLFGDVLSPLAAGLKTNSQSMTPGFGSGGIGGAPTTGGGTGTVVR